MSFGQPLDPTMVPRAPRVSPQAPLAPGQPLDPTQVPRAPPVPGMPSVAPGQPLDPTMVPKAPPRTAPAAIPTPGQGLDPQQAPPRPPAPPAPQPRLGQSVQLAPEPNRVSTQEVALGFSQQKAAVNLPPGASPQAQNWVAREGGLEPRWRVGALGSMNTFADDVLWLGEYSTVSGGRFPVALSARTLAWYSALAWRKASYSTQPTNDPLSGNDTNYIDATVLYDPVLDENTLCFVNGVDQAFVFDGPSRNTFSTLTNAPIAGTVTVLDNRVIFGNVTSGGTQFVQRVMWSARGDPQTYAEPTGGTEDLLSARGTIQKILGDGDQLVVWFDNEIWIGLKYDYPFDFQFVPLDQTIGTVSPWTVRRTPMGIMFLGSDNQVYVLPQGGTPRPVGGDVWRYIREQIDNPARACGELDPSQGAYLLAFPIQGGTGRGDVGVQVEPATGAWMPQTFAAPVTALGIAQLSSSATTWGGLIGTFQQQTATYAQLGGSGTARSLLVGHSTGTVGQFASGITGDLGALVDSRALIAIPVVDATKRTYLRELRIDYRAPSASSVTLRLSADWGASFPQEIGVALPAASVSGQTVVPLGFAAIEPSIQVQHDQGHRFALTRMNAVTESIGRG